MATILEEKEIRKIVEHIDVVAAMEEGFIEYSKGNSVVPPVGELLFENPRREVHLKYGYILNDDFFCVKIAGGFYSNAAIGLSTSQGLMLLFSQKTGEIFAVLLDGGYLTDVRTAGAGALAAKYLAPKKTSAIGIIGSGIQAKMQLQYLQKTRPCQSVWIWNRTLRSAEKLRDELSSNFDIRVAESPAEVAANCNLIVTTTPAKKPLLQAADIQPGTHITAVGSDTAEKQELAGELLAKADLVIVDSIAQSRSRGETFKATKEGAIDSSEVVELGSVLQDKSLQRTNDSQVTVADLTGVAVQDIMIAKRVYAAYIDEISG